MSKIFVFYDFVYCILRSSVIICMGCCNTSFDILFVLEYHQLAIAKNDRLFRERIKRRGADGFDEDFDRLV